MALIVRIDVDRPYGKHPITRHVLSKVSSDLYFPKVEAFGYLDELKQMLLMLGERKARAYVFFRECTLPSESILRLMKEGRHEIGLHLENSRTFETFLAEKQKLESHVGQPILAMSKHGSGVFKYGRRHYAPYEMDKYIEWARRTKMKVLFGNLEDPTIEPLDTELGVACFPAAFWLEPYWRNTVKFPDDWLFSNARERDTVLLVHPENVLESPKISQSFIRLIDGIETKILP
jgi:hypothetical protein